MRAPRTSSGSEVTIASTHLARRVEHLGDLVGADAVAERLDHAVVAAHEEEVALLVAANEVAGEDDALGVRRSRRPQRVRAEHAARRLGVVPVAERDRRPAVHELADLARRTRRQFVAVQHQDLGAGDRPADRVGLAVDTRRGAGRCCGRPR